MFAHRPNATPYVLKVTSYRRMATWTPDVCPQNLYAAVVCANIFLGGASAMFVLFYSIICIQGPSPSFLLCGILTLDCFLMASA